MVRFSRDEIIQHRKLTKILPEMREHIDIISIHPLEPETSKPYDPEEV